ncbi:MAG TPA: hypothetical protein VFJ23_05790 [Candidatus Nitrosotalea sp.]|nr:hypothetical protein [Candidatus Nitrosotalea sp.]
MNKIVLVAIIAVIVIGIVIAYNANQNSSVKSNQVSTTQTQDITNSTIQPSTGNNVHKTIHITLNDGMGVQSP